MHGDLPDSLAALGVRADDVTDVIFTHLHFDHIGWASADGAPFFPNATYRCAAADLDYFLAGPDEEQFTSALFYAATARERLAPVLDRIETWAADRALLPGIDVRLAPGHTPGSSVIVLSDGNERALLLGDMVHCPLELMDDDFNLLADHDQELANRVREAYARELEGTGTLAAAAHFPGLRFGRLLPGETTAALELCELVGGVSRQLRTSGAAGSRRRGGSGANTLRSVRTGPSTVTFGRACCTAMLSHATRSWWRQSCS